MKRKGFTLVELLVVIAIIALLMGILMPALARVRALAHRMVCGTNLSGIGKAMMIYSNDYDEDYPVAGCRGPAWSSNGYITDWTGGNGTGDDTVAYGGTGPGNTVTVTSSFFLLIKYADVGTKSFVCRGDGATVWSPSEENSNLDLTDAWDFGQTPGLYCSYSYHDPFRFPITVASSPAAPIAGERNPYLDMKAVGYLNGVDPDEVAPSWTNNEYLDKDNTGNAAAHQREGQNVLFNDIHVSFEKQPNCGIDMDNIWKRWPSITPTVQQKQLDGNPPTATGNGNALAEKDAYLVNEYNDADGRL